LLDLILKYQRKSRLHTFHIDYLEAKPTIEEFIPRDLSERSERYTSQMIAACIFNRSLHESAANTLTLPFMPNCQFPNMQISGHYFRAQESYDLILDLHNPRGAFSDVL
jgi:hypothetical protein